MRRFADYLIFGFLALAFIGCATAPKVSVPAVSLKAVPGLSYHKVTKGQTLWRIARLYGMDVEELVSMNNIQDSSKLEVGRQLIIPTERKTRTALPNNVEEDFIWPVKGKVVSAFSQADNALNKGINIEPSRSADVLASRGGKVAFFNDDFLDLGKTIILEHPGGFWTVYGRNLEVYVKPGDEVVKGMVIAKAGIAGRGRKTYLHFEIRKGSKAQNPLFYLPN
ncbi:MAG: peptidoglycan DD-metalloendopeptidase family protein [Candidatus Omnitrophica bacterium]|nr:peptidoglycan DD-metalloendopeptidase family protein [Candidatus Omnitrophota bacterium]